MAAFFEHAGKLLGHLETYGRPINCCNFLPSSLHPLLDCFVQNYERTSPKIDVSVAVRPINAKQLNTFPYHKHLCQQMHRGTGSIICKVDAEQ